MAATGAEFVSCPHSVMGTGQKAASGCHGFRTAAKRPSVAPSNFSFKSFKGAIRFKAGRLLSGTVVVICKHMGLQSRRFSSEATQGRFWSKKGNVLIWLSLPLFCLELLYFWPLGVSDVLCWQ